MTIIPHGGELALRLIEIMGQPNVGKFLNTLDGECAVWAWQNGFPFGIMKVKGGWKTFASTPQMD